MTAPADLEGWILSALKDRGGAVSIVEVAKHIWANHEAELRSSDELFYTWQYQMRWAAQRLQKIGKLKKTKEGPKARWLLLPKGT